VGTLSFMRQVDSCSRVPARLSVILLNRNLGRRETHELELVHCFLDCFRCYCWADWQCVLLCSQVRNVWPIVHLGNTVTHIIDDNSPLRDFSADDLLSGDHFFVVLFTGLDSVINENMFSRKTYHSCDLLVGHRFVDNIKLAADGLHIDLDCIHDTRLTPDANGLEDIERHQANASDRSWSSEQGQQRAVISPASGRIENRFTLSAESPRQSYWQMDAA
jgi:hypothetical protein